MLVFSAPRCLFVKANTALAKISPEVVLLLIQASHHAITFAFAAQLEHAESLADTALPAGKFVLGGLVVVLVIVATSELLVETSATAKASRGFRVLLVLGWRTEETVSAALFFTLTLT